MQVFSPEYFDLPYELIPRFVMAVILFIALFAGRATALTYGLIFGLLSDVVYTDYIGIYFFAMAFTAYIIASIAALFHHKNLFTIFILGLFGIVMLEFQVYGLYIVVGIAQVSMDHFLYERLLPTLILNGVFIVLAYYPLRRYFHALDAAKRENKRAIG